MWREENNTLSKEFAFSEYPEAVSFVMRVAMISERLDHHPTVTLGYKTVLVSTTTHSAGDIVTDKDQKLALAIDRIMAGSVG
jgi:4a-hydroxytetrahydrobiopterin dehydratase